MDEKPVATARASVMLFDNSSNSWVASGSTQGISKVQLFRHQINNTYRVVGWKLNDKEVVLNCAIFRGLKYNQARPTFHQWRDSKHQVYGLNFTSKEEAEAFAGAVTEALDNLNQIYKQSQQIMAATAAQQQQQVQQQQVQIQQQMSGPAAAAIIDMQQQQQLQVQQQQQQQYQLEAYQQAATQQVQLQQQMQLQQQLSQSSGNYQNTVSGNSSMPEYALPIKQQPQMNMGSLNNIGDSYAYGAPSNGSTGGDYRGMQQEDISKSLPIAPVAAGPPPPPPPGPPPPTTAPPPPPGPPPLSSIALARPQQQQNDSDDESNQSGLASQLRQAKLKSRGGPSELPPDPSNQAKTNVTSSATLGRAGGDSMMSEMQRVLAARKKAKEVVKPGPNDCNDSGGSGDSSTKNSQWRQNHHRSQSDCDQVNGANNQTNKTGGPIGAGTDTGGKAPSAPVTALQCATLGRKGSLQPDQQSQFQSQSQSQSQSQLSGNGITRQDLDAFKREILQEVRIMIQQFKADIIDVIRVSKP